MVLRDMHHTPLLSLKLPRTKVALKHFGHGRYCLLNEQSLTVINGSTPSQLRRNLIEAHVNENQISRAIVVDFFGMASLHMMQNVCTVFTYVAIRLWGVSLRVRTECEPSAVIVEAMISCSLLIFEPLRTQIALIFKAFRCQVRHSCQHSQRLLFDWSLFFGRSILNLILVEWLRMLRETFAALIFVRTLPV